MPDKDKLLTPREIAVYMQMNERTVLKLAQAGEIPGTQVGGQWRFRRDIIDAWLAERMGHSSDDAEQIDAQAIPDGARIPLVDLLDVECIVSDLGAKDRAQAIKAMVQRALERGYVGDIVERESLASTAMDGGVAFLHTRQRGASKVTRPFIIVGRSYQGVDFGAPDGKPTFMFFLLGLKYDRLHLPILGRLARVMKNSAVVAKLRAAPTPQRIREILVQEDAALLKKK
jgi:excisionase family DNA binding protein